jgi:hypothetical protein
MIPLRLKSQTEHQPWNGFDNTRAPRWGKASPCAAPAFAWETNPNQAFSLLFI